MIRKSQDHQFPYPLAGLSEGAGAISALVGLVVGMDQPVPVEGSLTAQHFTTVTTLESALTIQMSLYLQDFNIRVPVPYRRTSILSEK
jgi:hypothetical protein